MPWCKRLGIPEGSGVPTACVRSFFELLQVESVEDKVWDDPLQCSCGGLSGARCLDCMASLIESDVS